jgi:hypothetical protein
MDSLIVALALLQRVPSPDRAEGVQGLAFAPRVAFATMERQGRIIAPVEVASLETRPAVQCERPNIWHVND